MLKISSSAGLEYRRSQIFDGIVYDEKNDTYGIRMGEFVPILMKAVQELKTEVDQLKAEISKLKK